MSATAMVTCGSCGDQTPAGKKFCIHCGSPVLHACPACGEPVLAGANFCAECGTPLTGTSPAIAPAPGTAAAVVSERRLVSVLFADLVGFTTLSEHRDPEEVRDLLSRYFDRCRSLIERYGGTVEKFIGDAVMAVWGTPVAREDDAERAVRAALALTQAVTLLGEEVGMPELRVRAGVLTGNAAVELGSEGEGMVLGDTVNTASRLQSIAEPGTVLVDDVTRRASEAAIAYEDAGEHQVKGREQPVRAWTALRVVAGVGGARRSVRPRGAVRRSATRSCRRSSTPRDAARHDGNGASRGRRRRGGLGQVATAVGVLQVPRRDQGGSLLASGPLPLLRRGSRVLGAGGDDPRPGRNHRGGGPGDARVEKLRAAVEEFVDDERERRLVEPRLAHLLRLEERPDADRADLFSGWRLFFERMAADRAR